MNKENLSSVALLSNDGDMTSFRYGNNNIRFRSPKCLKRYTEVKEWDKGYIVVMADYEGLGETEEYIDLLPILKNLYINPETFLKPIKSVMICGYYLYFLIWHKDTTALGQRYRLGGSSSRYLRF